jgi:site-specific recombinase XerD
VTEGFVSYLLQERALSPATGQNYREFVQDFLRDRFGTRTVNFTSLCAADILRFAQSRATGYSKRARIMPTALRSFFRYLRYKGLIETDLASAVPSVAQWSMSSVPKALSSSQIKLLIASRRGAAALERRDYATFLLLARLGLRAGEVVALTLDDIDWQEGCITVRGKGGSCTKMPLPAEVGEAIADYLLDGRPTSKLRHVFLSAKAPVTHLTPSGLSTRVKDALNAVGIDAPNRGSHLFRHSLATNMLRSGASLAEIGELLRHRSTQTTEIYAKVDFSSLGQLALPWTGGAQ